MIGPKKIPSLVGLGIIALLVFLVSRGSTSIFQILSNASKSIEPKSLQITNMSDTGFTVNWITSDPATGTVVVAGDGLTAQSFFDDRDKSGKQNAYTTHMIHVRDLQPNTPYSVSLISNGVAYNTLPQLKSIRTTNSISQNKQALSPAYGTAKTADGKPAKGALVYLYFRTSQMLSTMVTDSGSWIMPLHQIHTASMDAYYSPQDLEPLMIKIQTELAETIITTTTEFDSPVPEVLLGKTYDFRLKALQDFEESQSVLGDISDNLPLENPVLSITQPQEGDALVSHRPLFQGTAKPGTIITLTVTSMKPKSIEIKAADDGVWKYSPTSDIGIGKQTITANTDEEESIVRTFTILKSGTQVLGEATPSGTIVPTAIPTIEPTLEPSLEPTLEPSPTGTLSATPTIDTDIDLQPGGPTPVILIAALGVLLILGGLRFLF